MSNIVGKDKKVTERLFTVTWEEIVIISAQIWAKTPEEAKKLAEHGSLDDLVAPSGCFSEFVTDSCEVTDETEGATKKDYESGGINCIEIYY